jgi:D-hydroxyproline dehydrogenase subunit gamma
MTYGDLRMASPVVRGRLLTILVDGQELPAHEGETVAAALLAASRRVLRTTAGGEPRSYFCGMGLCHDCLVIVDGRPNVRACTTPVRNGLRVEIQHGAGEWSSPS